MGMDRPNILFIMTDEQRWDYAGYMGQPALATPNLDRLAEHGIAFTRCYSANPVCMPARCSIHTGLYSFQTGQMDNRGDWPLDLPTFTQALQQVGYHTALTGKLHAHEAIGRAPDLTQGEWAQEVRALGFDDVCQVAGKGMAFFADDDYTHHLDARGLLDRYREYMVEITEGKVLPGTPAPLPEEDYADNFIGRVACDWLQKYRGEEPFFHMVSFCSPHPHFDAYQRALDRIDLHQVALPVEGEVDTSSARFREDPAKYRETWRRLRASYLAMIEIVDENIGRLLQTLETRGFLKNTLILFTSDHGTMLGDLGKGAKCWWEDPSVRVPLIAYYQPWEGRRPRAEDTLVSNHDVTATMLHAAAGEDCAGRWLPGCSSRSLLPFITGEKWSVRQFIYSETGPQFGPAWRMVDNGSYKYVYRLDSRQDLLFDLRRDPHCLRNLAGEGNYQAALRALQETMLKLLASHPAPKRGKAAFTPGVPHSIRREGLRRQRERDA